MVSLCRVKSLTCEISSLHRHLDSLKELPDNESLANSRYRERLREMGEELASSTAKCRRFEEEMVRMQASVEGKKRHAILLFGDVVSLLYVALLLEVIAMLIIHCFLFFRNVKANF